MTWWQVALIAAGALVLGVAIGRAQADPLRQRFYTSNAEWQRSVKWE